MLAGRLALALTLAVSAPNLANAAKTFQFSFDDSGGGPDGTIGILVIGNGSFVSPFNLLPGTYALSSLTGFTMSFAFGPEVFLSSDIVTPINEVAVEITAEGATTDRLVFIENGSPSDGGPFGSALELVNSDANILTFAPSNDGHNLYSLIGDFELGGNYLALSGSVPDPNLGSVTASLRNAWLVHDDNRAVVNETCLIDRHNRRCKALPATAAVL